VLEQGGWMVGFCEGCELWLYYNAGLYKEALDCFSNISFSLMVYINSELIFDTSLC